MINKNDYKEELKNFLERMKEFYNEHASIELGKNVYRGHVESMSNYFENEFTKFISKVLDNEAYRYYIDFTIKGNLIL